MLNRNYFCSARLIIAALTIFSSYPVLAQNQEPTSKPLVVTFDFGDRKVPIVFHSCPSGKLKPGEPKPPAPGEMPADAISASGIGGAVSIDEFYISETEVTVSQFAGVLGQSKFDAFREAAKKKLRGAAAEDATLLDNPASFPIFMVRPEDAIDFCKILETAKIEEQSQPSQLERRRFRLPSHYEWQYACRGRTDPAASQTFPHFHNWVELDSLTKEVKAKCLEEWKEMGRKEDEFLGTQFQVMEIVVARNNSGTNPKPLEILSAFLRESVGTHRDYSKPLLGKISAVGGAKPNPWGLMDMHENVAEWTIAIADKGNVQIFWSSIVSDVVLPESQSRKVFALAGGSFNYIMYGKNLADWEQFTIWGAKKVESLPNSPQSFSLDEVAAANLTDEYQPGLRIVMDRVLSDNWLLAVRRSALPNSTNRSNSSNELERYRATVREIVPASQQIELLATIDFYGGLAAYTAGRPAEAASVLDSIKDKMFKAKKKKFDIASLGGFTDTTASVKPTSETPKETEDQAFQRLLQTLVADDGSSAQ